MIMYIFSFAKAFDSANEMKYQKDFFLLWEQNLCRNKNKSIHQSYGLISKFSIRFG